MTDINDNDMVKDDRTSRNYSQIFDDDPIIVNYDGADDNDNGETVNYDPNIGGTDMTGTEDPDPSNSDYTVIQGGDEDDMEANHITTSSPSEYILAPTKWNTEGGVSTGTGSAFFDTSSTNVLLKLAPVNPASHIQYYVNVKNGAHVVLQTPTKTSVGDLTGSKFNVDTGGYFEIQGSNAPSLFKGVTFSILGTGTLKFSSPLSQNQLDILSTINLRFGSEQNGAPTLYIRPAREATRIDLSHLTGFKTKGASIKIAGARSIRAAYQNPDNPNQTVIETDNGKSIIINGDFYENNIYQEYNNGNLYLSASNNNSLGSDAVVFITCYLAGSMVEMADGSHCPIERIRIGDQVATYDLLGQLIQPEPVIWTGKGRFSRQVFHDGLPMDQSGFPVRILHHAIAENVPNKDMLITPEHCLFMQGHFIPIRMLVNGVSIYYEPSRTEYDYYHIELARHAIIKVDGVLSETYLDTGNRYLFNQDQKLVNFPGMSVKSWGQDAAAPLGAYRELVEPIFNRLKKRAQKICPVCHGDRAPNLTDDPGLYLLTETGHSIQVTYKKGDTVFFMIPAQVRQVRIMSRVSRPCDVVGPFIDDRRSLGVLIGKVMLVNPEHIYQLTDHLRKEQMTGWYKKENSVCRWTTGDALLNLPSHSMADKVGSSIQAPSRIQKGNKPEIRLMARKLSIQILSGGPYRTGQKQRHIA